MLRSGSNQTVGGGIPVSQQSADALLFRLDRANFNSTADQALVKQGSFGDFIIERIIVCNASVPMTTALGGVYTGAAKTGVVVVLATQNYSGLNSATATINMSLANTDKRSNLVSLFLSLSTPQGSTATADVLVYGYAIT